MTRTLCETSPYGDRLPDSVVLRVDNLHDVGSTYLIPHTIPRPDITGSYDHFQLSHQSYGPHHDELSLPPQRIHPSDLLESPGSESSEDTSTDRFPQPPEIYDPWAPLHPPADLFQIVTYGVPPPTLHHHGLDPRLYPNSPSHHLPWFTGALIGSADKELPTPIDCQPSAPLHNSPPSPHPHLDGILKPYSGTSDTSYPCLWTKGGVICNVLVQANRSYMNRHLHAHHGFGGSDTRQAKCYWAGCGATMQQGSIARHMVTCHLQAKVTCPMCFKKLSRQDVISKHQRICPAAGTWL